MEDEGHRVEQLAADSGEKQKVVFDWSSGRNGNGQSCRGGSCEQRDRSGVEVVSGVCHSRRYRDVEVDAAGEAVETVH